MVALVVLGKMMVVDMNFESDSPGFEPWLYHFLKA